MLCINKLPGIDEGVGALFDTEDVICILMDQMLQKGNVKEKFLYFVGVSAEDFSEYYRLVLQRCKELDEIFFNEDKEINRSPAFPKTMFLFDTIDSYRNFIKVFAEVEEPQEQLVYEWAYGSTNYLVMNLSFYCPVNIYQMRKDNIVKCGRIVQRDNSDVRLE